MDRFTLSETEWRKRLSMDQYSVLREGANEAPFTGRYDNNKADGLYRCAGCGAPLFDSADKFEATCGYACFTQPVAPDRVGAHGGTGSGLKRMEARCTRCDGHLGHIFDDGPPPTGLRYTINSLSLDFRGRGTED